MKDHISLVFERKNHNGCIIKMLPLCEFQNFCCLVNEFLIYLLVMELRSNGNNLIM